MRIFPRPPTFMANFYAHFSVSISTDKNYMDTERERENSLMINQIISSRRSRILNEENVSDRISYMREEREREAERRTNDFLRDKHQFIGLVRNTSNVNMGCMYNRREREEQHINNYLSKMPHHTESRGMPSTNPFLSLSSPTCSILSLSLPSAVVSNGHSFILTGSSLLPEATCIYIGYSEERQSCA